jgi:hypothetical protein
MRPLENRWHSFVTEFLRKNAITVITLGPQFVIPRHKQFRPGEGESRQTFFQRVAIRNRRVADHHQHISRFGVHFVDQIIGERFAPGMVVMQVGGDQQPHLSWSCCSTLLVGQTFNVCPSPQPTSIMQNPS